jgi:hypothetical protein
MIGWLYAGYRDAADVSGTEYEREGFDEYNEK